MPDSSRPQRSARTWVNAEIEGKTVGHAPLPVARRWSLEQLEIAEEAERVLTEKLDAAAAELRTAQGKRDTLYAQRQAARDVVKRRRQDLAYRCESMDEGNAPADE
jgi:hypothetical protein